MSYNGYNYSSQTGQQYNAYTYYDDNYDYNVSNNNSEHPVSTQEPTNYLDTTAEETAPRSPEWSGPQYDADNGWGWYWARIWPNGQWEYRSCDDNAGATSGGNPNPAADALASASAVGPAAPNSTDNAGPGDYTQPQSQYAAHVQDQTPSQYPYPYPDYHQGPYQQPEDAAANNNNNNGDGTAADDGNTPRRDGHSSTPRSKKHKRSGHHARQPDLYIINRGNMEVRRHRR
ncbi:hypothetical protein F4775DRAFT_591576 [Biscogniauxia sp. FL1348]|nr:hypothetical protein F4775DRAFT_591576 [Biscogniauxia sp. FL1348]